MNAYRFLVTGCSGGGKSTVIEALAESGVNVMPEAGRLIVKQQMIENGRTLPWKDLAAFIEKLWNTALEQFDSASRINGLVLFDRGFIEALAYWKLHDSAKFEAGKQEVVHRRYCSPAFVAPPWRQLFQNDSERRHTFSAAVIEYDAICETLDDLGYDTLEIPKLEIEQRAAFIRTHIDIAQKSVQ